MESEATPTPVTDRMLNMAHATAERMAKTEAVLTELFDRLFAESPCPPVGSADSFPGKPGVANDLLALQDANLGRADRLLSIAAILSARI